MNETLRSDGYCNLFDVAGENSSVISRRRMIFKTR